MKILSHVVTAFFFLVGVAIFGLNAKKLYDGCQQDQVMIRSVVSYECVRR